MIAKNNHYLLLILALAMGLLFHGTTLFSTLENTYDLYVHLFFADHYSQNWFDPWEVRWYTGFSVMSYPPLAHQLMALFSFIGGLKFAAYALGFAIILLYITGAYRFGKLISGNDRAAGYTALIAVFIPSVVESLHVFGQLPMMLGIGWLLHALPEIYLWVRHGKWNNFINGVSIIAVAVCSHHVTPIFGMVFFVLPLMGTAVLDKAREEVNSYGEIGIPLFFKYFKKLLPRIILIGLSIVAVAVLVILPYWLHSRSNPITQVPIPHGSRDNFLEVLSSGLVFFLIPYGFLLALFPYFLYRFFSKRNIFLGLSFVLLFILGTGGTTPIPKALLGENAFSILTLERFTFWATMLSMPLAGEFLWSFFEGPIKQRILKSNSLKVYNALIGVVVISIFASAGFTLNLGYFRALQPKNVEISPILNFINTDKHDKWRYLTLGFGDQMAWLSANTHALTIDGNYHSARRVPELTSRAVERLENSKYRGTEGIGSLQQFLTYPNKYHLKYIFSNDKFYDPLLYFCGWHRVKFLDNNIMVWEREDVTALPSSLPKKSIPNYQKIMWGVIPIVCLIIAFVCNVQLHWINHIARKNQNRVDYSNPESLEQNMNPSVYKASKFWFYMLAIIIAVGIYKVYFYNLTQTSAEKVVESYYDALDFKEFDKAHSFLDPREPYPLEQFMLEMSVQDGLVDSYGKINDIKTEIIRSDEKQALVRVDLTYITALEVFNDTHEHIVKKKGNKWYIKPKPLEYSIPANQFISTNTTIFKNQGRKKITTEETFHTDILDRPVIHIISASLVELKGQYSVVGLLQNIDSYPADVSLKSSLFGSDGNELTSYSEKFHLIHKLSPKEVTPFRIDFEGDLWRVKKTGVSTFDPKTFVQNMLNDTACSFSLEALATVTTHDLYKEMALTHVVSKNESISGELFNYGTNSVTIPQMLFSYYDEKDELIWVDHKFIKKGIMSRRNGLFNKKKPELNSLTLIASDSETILVNGLDNHLITDKYKQNRSTSACYYVSANWPGVSKVGIALNNYIGNPTPH